MKIYITEELASILEIENLTSIIEVADFDTGVGKIPLAEFESAGDLLFGTAAGEVDNLPPEDDGDLLTLSGGFPAWVTPASSVVDHHVFEARLTLETGEPVSQSDQADKTTIYLTPAIRGNRLGLYSSGSWAQVLLSSEISIKATDSQTGTIASGSAVVSGLSDASQFVVGMEVTGTGIPGGTTILTVDTDTQITLDANATDDGPQTLTFKLPDATNYDIFVYSNSGTAKLEFGLAWSDATTRVTGITKQDGEYVKSGDATRRYAGTIRTSAAGQVSDTLLKRFVWNLFNQVYRPLLVTESTDDWTYTLDTVHPWNGSTANRVEFVIGLDYPLLELDFHAEVYPNNQNAYVGIGLDATDTNHANLWNQINKDALGAGAGTTSAHYRGYPGLGYHYLQLLEWLASGGTVTYYGDHGARSQSGAKGGLLG